MIISIFIIIFVFLFHSFLICYTLFVMDQSSSHILITSNYSEQLLLRKQITIPAQSRNVRIIYLFGIHMVQ